MATKTVKVPKRKVGGLIIGLEKPSRTRLSSAQATIIHDVLAKLRSRKSK